MLNTLRGLCTVYVCASRDKLTDDGSGVTPRTADSGEGGAIVASTRHKHYVVLVTEFTEPFHHRTGGRKNGDEEHYHIYTVDTTLIVLCMHTHTHTLCWSSEKTLRS